MRFVSIGGMCQTAERIAWTAQLPSGAHVGAGKRSSEHRPKGNVYDTSGSVLKVLGLRKCSAQDAPSCRDVRGGVPFRQEHIKIGMQAGIRLSCST